MRKRMTEKIVDLEYWSRTDYWRMAVRDSKTGKKKEFGVQGFYSLSNYHEGDVVKIEYTEPSSFLDRIFGDTTVHNITKVRCVVLERQLAKIKSVRHGNIPHVAKLLSEREYQGCVKLRGSLENVTRLAYNLVQNVEGWSSFQDADNMLDEIDAIPCFTASFSVEKNHVCYIGVYCEPVDNMNTNVHIAGFTADFSFLGRKFEANLENTKKLVSRINAKLSQASK